MIVLACNTEASANSHSLEGQGKVADSRNVTVLLPSVCSTQYHRLSDLNQQSPAFLARGTSFMEDNLPRTRAGAGEGTVQVVTRVMGSDGTQWGVMGRDGERWGAANEASLSRPLLTSCWEARFLTGHGSLPVHSPGVGGP